MNVSELFKLDGRTNEHDSKPAITKWGFEDLEDDPTQHRWRASWVRGYYDSTITGISLSAHPVLKETPCGVWINENGYREATKQPWEEGAPALGWITFDEKWMKKRFVHFGSGSAWAKPTQEEAIRSLAIRLSRWSNHVASEVDRLWSATKVMRELRPQYPSYVDHAHRNVCSLNGIIEQAMRVEMLERERALDEIAAMEDNTPKKQVHWASDYGNILTGWHETRAKADKHNAQYEGRKFVIRREWVEGEKLPKYFTEDV